MTTHLPDILCFCHLRWHFIPQRPHHLMQRFAGERRVWYMEEPAFEEGRVRLELSEPHPDVHVAVPHVPRGMTAKAMEATLRMLTDSLIQSRIRSQYVAWTTTPSAMLAMRHLDPTAVVYDCMDDLSSLGNPSDLEPLQDELLASADIVFTGGHSLHEGMRGRHANVHHVPSSVDVAHFRRARAGLQQPLDQGSIPRPRLGFHGVIDDRIDLDLVSAVADAHPEWSIVLIGPVVRVDPARLPRQGNVHWLGMKRYSELPTYLAGWDVALMPFTPGAHSRVGAKVLEYLAAGLRVAATPLPDVVRATGDRGLVTVGALAPTFAAAIQTCLREGPSPLWLGNVDTVVSRTSWERTFTTMKEEVDRFAPAVDEPPERPFVFRGK